MSILTAGGICTGEKRRADKFGLGSERTLVRNQLACVSPFQPFMWSSVSPLSSCSSSSSSLSYWNQCAVDWVSACVCLFMCVCFLVCVCVWHSNASPLPVPLTYSWKAVNSCWWAASTSNPVFCVHMSEKKACWTLKKNSHPLYPAPQHSPSPLPPCPIRAAVPCSAARRVQTLIADAPSLMLHCYSNQSCNSRRCLHCIPLPYCDPAIVWPETRSKSSPPVLLPSPEGGGGGVKLQYDALGRQADPLV